MTQVQQEMTEWMVYFFLFLFVATWFLSFFIDKDRND